MIPIYSPPKKGTRQWIPPAVVPPALIVTGSSKHNSLFDGTSIWLANSAGSSVFKYDINALTFEEFLTSSFLVTGLAYDGTNIWTAGFGNETLTKLSPAGVVLGTYNPAVSSTEQGYHQIISDGSHVYAPLYWGGIVAKLNLEGTVAGEAVVNQYPLGITDLGTHIYVACFDFTTSAQGTGKVVKILKSDMSIVASWTIGANPSDITNDGTFLWVSSFSGGYVYKVNPADGTILATYNTGIASSNQTTIRHIGNGWNLLAVTVTKDYQGANLAGTYNKVHFLKESDGSSFQISDAAGIDLRNGSLDSLDYVWFGGYADGSVTRILLELSGEPIPSATVFSTNNYPLTPSQTSFYAFAVTASVPTIYKMSVSSLLVEDTIAPDEAFSASWLYLVHPQVASSGLLVYGKLTVGSSSFLLVYDPATDTTNNYLLDTLYELNDFILIGDFAYCISGHYTETRVAKLDIRDGTLTFSSSGTLPAIADKGITYAEGKLWVFSTVYNTNTTGILTEVATDFSTSTQHSLTGTEYIYGNGERPIAYLNGSIFMLGYHGTNGNAGRIIEYEIATGVITVTVLDTLPEYVIPFGDVLLIRNTTEGSVYKHSVFDPATNSITSTEDGFITTKLSETAALGILNTTADSVVSLTI